MINLIVSIDVEAHRTKDEIGIHGGSLTNILVLLKKYDISATFFIDTTEVAKWGFDYLFEVCSEIKRFSPDHLFGLHVHPHHYSGDDRWLLHQYDYDMQKKIIEYSKDNYIKMIGEYPKVFRAGGFGADDNTLKILSELRIANDSSLLFGHKNCKISASKLAGVTPSDVSEIPLTSVVTFCIGSRVVRSSCLDFNWMPNFFLIRVINRLRKNNIGTVVLLMHSSSLVMRDSQSTVRYSSRIYRKLEKLLSNIREMDLNIANFNSDNLIASNNYLYFERNIFIQFALIFYQAFVGKGFNKKFFYFYWITLVSIFIVILFIVLWSIA